MPIADNNPFAAPQSEDAPRPDPLVELHGRMPGSVKLAIGSLIAFLGLTLAALSLLLALGGVSFYELLLMAVLGGGVAVLVGVFRRNRFSRVCARAMGVGLGSLIMLLVAVSTISLIGFYSDSDFQSSMQQAGAPFGGWEMTLSLVLGMSIYVIPAVLLLTVFFTLGTTTARQYFYLLCPECHGKRVTAVNRSADHLHCSGCGHEWRPPQSTQPNVTAR
ncbi:hypothetical protein Pla123a_18070 [Posidoniimonas polymericola]|uniref:Uncharacterized protein n=1 Tax=Posidoniimonas polymericola TaxID=2528002 RepID=A0A5C5YTL7_9BACT|nr:hypothetical protein [Posidoniimonas polymericola]TWT78007.1 hypothetical protein Pla123a_18070 [Posidoniimonas polymericola]